MTPDTKERLRKDWMHPQTGNSAFIGYIQALSHEIADWNGAQHAIDQIRLSYELRKEIKNAA